MSSAPPSRVLVSHKFAEDRHLSSLGEVIIVRLSQDLFGPGSIVISSRNLPSRATKHNYHHAVVLDIVLKPVQNVLIFTVLPMPAYSATDPTSGLTSTSWLLSQPVDFQQRHIPVPYEQTSSLPQPQSPTPAGFGDPLKVGGWKDSKPRWVLAVPQVTYTTTARTSSLKQILPPDVLAQFKCFSPPVKLNEDEVMRLRAYSGLPPSPVVPSSSTMSPFPPGGGGSAFGGPDTLPPGNGTIPDGGSNSHQPNERDNHAGAGLPAGSSLAFQALYANDAVKQAFASLTKPSIILDSDSDDDDWEDRMDPVTFARYYAHSNRHLAKIVQEHDQKMRERLHQDITSWVKGIQPETFEGDVL